MALYIGGAGDAGSIDRFQETCARGSPHRLHLRVLYIAQISSLRIPIRKFSVSSRKHRLIPSFLGPLPVQAINNALDLEIDAGDVVMSVNAQKHARRRHPTEFAMCFPHVASIISSPLYVRDDFANDGKIEMVGKSAGLGEYLLVAVEISLDDDGKYNVVSFYPISEKKVANRRESGHLVRIILV